MSTMLCGIGKRFFLLIAFSLLLSFGGFCEGPQPGLKFIQNKNQWNANVHFASNIPGGSMTIGPGRFSYYFVDYKKLQELHEKSHDFFQPDAGTDDKINGHVLQANFIGANLNATPLPFGKSDEYYNYFLGDNQSKWASKAYAFEGMLYQAFYKNIDLKIYSSGQHLKYDFIVEPYGDPSQISVMYDGADAVDVENGNVILKTSLAEIIEKRPFSYQFIAGEKVIVECIYHLEGKLLSFCFPSGYDPCYELVIDPLLIFSTFSGSTADNWGSTATPGENGNLYSSGVTNQAVVGKFPATAGAFQTNSGGMYDVGILKYDSTGSKLLYASYLGGGDSESPHSLYMNANDELIVLGTTSSRNFPTTEGVLDRIFNEGLPTANVIGYNNGSDIFVTRIKKDGTALLASTYLGGSLNDGLSPSNSFLNNSPLVMNYGDELRGDVITDEIGNIYISSVTGSHDFPMVNSFNTIFRGGTTDAIILKLNAGLSQMIWGAYLGGNSFDTSHTLKLDSHGNVYVAGGTTSADFPVTAGSYKTTKIGGDADGWIAKIAADGSSILNATYTGTTSWDQIYFLDLNSSEEVYVYGQTGGLNFPKVPSTVHYEINSGQFLQKFDNTLTTLKVSTVFGSGRGVPDISPTAFLVNDCNNIYMSGWGGGALNSRVSGWPTRTNNLSVSADAYQKTTTGNDFYFIVLTNDAKDFLYGTYLGGLQTLTHVDGGTSRFDKHGIVYHAVCAGCNTDGKGPKSDFPTTAGAWSRTNRSNNCNNAAFKFDLSSLKAALQTNTVKLDKPGIRSVCIPDSMVFQNTSIGGELYQWDLGDGTKIEKTKPIPIIHQYTSPGQYIVRLKAIDRGTCKAVDSTSTTITVNKSGSAVQGDDHICFGDAYTLKASGGATYDWKTLNGDFVSDQATPTVSPADTTRYMITIIESSGCIRKDTIQLDVIPGIKPDFKFSRQSACSERPVVYFNNLTDSLQSDDLVFFDFGDGITSDMPESEHLYEKDGLYHVRLTGVRHACVYEKTADIPVFKIKLPNIITPGNAEGLNDVFTVQYGDKQGVTPSNYGFKVELTIYNRWGGVLLKTNDYQYDWSGEGLAAGVYYYDVSIQEHATCKSWLQIVK